ncbi:uncharacterized protein EI90DRAFT_2912352 [Cantharellus anzutake]|uniref:uncharacterized protein n=1 Tax=Cantharellus anzutake TaxID=1750568 RepID=UPI0019058E74|nr:uncharacterized protein EI90DRAFT_2912352 [Cantharellus anzutake]KAF8335868.1 hypothetical protein EI90DRAFT_2912352 [Cantharellus anzutake]
MTARSFDSSVSRRSRRERITNEDVYDYALRVAYLSHLMTPKPPPQAPETRRDESKDHHSRLSNIVAPINLLGDLFRDAGRDGHRSVKFPEKLLKVLDAKMQNVAMGKDIGYVDPYFRASIAVFWGSLKEPTFLRQMKENRKIEELILTFVSTATASLKKNPQLLGEAWKGELNKQIPMFIRMLRECLSNTSSVPTELVSRLELYSVKLNATAPHDTGSDSGYSTSRSPDPPAPGPSSTVTQYVADMPLVQTVARLFGYTNSQVQGDLSSLKQMCTEWAAIVDLKTCLKNIRAGVPFPGRREDFETEEAWQHWRTQELAHLSQLMVMMVKLNPELAGSNPSDSGAMRLPRPTSIHGNPEYDDESISRASSSASRRSLAIPNSWNPDAIAHIEQDDNETQTGHNFTYIPPNPKKFYKRLTELCMEYDLRAMAHLPEDQEVSLGILSQAHLELVNECALRWRINPSYRVACFFDIIKYKYEREEVPLECIPEGLQMVSKTLHDLPISKWPIDDVEYLAQVYGALFNIFLGLLYHTFENLGSIKLQDIEPCAAILARIRESGLMSRYSVDVNTRVGELSERVRGVAIQQYTAKSQEIANEHVGVNRAMPLLHLTDWVEKQVKLLDKRFPEPVLGILDVVALAIDGYYPMFLNDLDYSQRRLLEGSMNQPSPDIPIEDIFSLYRRTKTLGDMHRAFCPEANEDFDITGYFRPYVQQWIIITDNKTTQWTVQYSLGMSQFETEGEESHSSSIIDLFDSLKPPIDFLLELKWTDVYEEARFFTSLAKTISNAVQQYCRRIEDLFMAEMFPRPPPETQEKDRMALLMERAKMTMGGERKIEPFNFMASSCIKLNNIEAARKLLDQLYQRMDVDQISKRLDTLAPPVPPKTKERYLFTVKIVQAQNLPPNDSSSKLDTFVTLSDENGYRLAKTRTICDTLEPRWSQEFDFSVDNSLWLMASVRDRALIGKHDTIGRAYLCLDPKRYGDFLTHDLRLDLDPQGQIHIRVSMEGEKDDAQFYFGRAFRSLKRTGDDMTRVFIDKMSPLIQQCLSRNALKTLMKSGVPATLDYSRALSFKGFFGTKLTQDNGDVLIPLPAEERPRHRPGQLSAEEIELSISPLFAYFEKNLMDVLNQWLSDGTRETTVLKVWKEILNVIESLLIPPLSDLPSDMNPLSDKEVDVAFEWLRLLKDFFYADGEGPIPTEILQGQKYRDIQSIRLYYDWKTDDLMEECVRVMTQGLGGTQTLQKRAKSVYHHKNLGTIKNRKKEKSEKPQNSNDQIILRILRMRPNTSDFIGTQMRIMAAVQAEQENKMKRRAAMAGSRNSRSPVPPVPPLPRQ